MADRFAALAGYDAGSNYDSTVEQSLAAAAREDLPGLETVASINIDLPPSSHRHNRSRSRCSLIRASSASPTRISRLIPLSSSSQLPCPTPSICPPSQRFHPRNSSILPLRSPSMIHSKILLRPCLLSRPVDSCHISCLK